MFFKMDKGNLLTCFFEEPNRWYHLREYAKINKLSPSTSSKYLDFFYKKKMLMKKEEHNLTLYKSNEESEDFRDIKKFWNIKKIKESGILDFLEENLNTKGIIVFGSTANGLDNKSSDIDLFAMSSVKKEIKLETFEKILKKKIQLFIMDKKELKSKKEFANNVLNGIVIKGYIELF